MDDDRSTHDLIRWSRELRTLAAAVRKETEEQWVAYTANWERTLDLLPRIRATLSTNAVICMKRRPSHNSVDSATKRWSDGSSSAVDK
jgi:hypothetical protein